MTAIKAQLDGLPSDLFNKSARALSAARWLCMKRLFPNTRKVLALKAHPNQGKNETFEVKVEKENSVATSCWLISVYSYL